MSSAPFGTRGVWQLPQVRMPSTRYLPRSSDACAQASVAAIARTASQSLPFMFPPFSLFAALHHTIALVTSHRTFRLVAILGMAQTLAWGSTYYLPAVLANAMAAELGVSTATVFMTFSAGLLLTGFLGPGSGRLIDRFGGRGVLASSSLIFAAGLALLGSSSGAWSLLLAWLVIGVGMSAGLYEAAFSTLARIYGTDARRSITGITLIAGFASTVCWPLSAWMDASLGWRSTCHVWAAAHVLIGLPLNLLIPKSRSLPQATVEAPSTASPPRYALMAAISFVFAAGW